MRPPETKTYGRRPPGDLLSLGQTEAGDGPPPHTKTVLQKIKDSPRSKHRFHDETDCILKSRTSGITKWKHGKPGNDFNIRAV